MVLRWMMEGKIFVGTVDLLTVLMIVLLSLDGRLVAPGGAPGAVCRKRAGANNLPAGSVSKLRQEQDTGSEWLLLALDWQTLMPCKPIRRRRGA